MLILKLTRLLKKLKIMPNKWYKKYYEDVNFALMSINVLKRCTLNYFPV